MKEITKIMIWNDDWGMHVIGGRFEVFSGKKSLALDDVYEGAVTYGLSTGKLTKDTKIILKTQERSWDFKIKDFGTKSYKKEFDEFSEWLKEYSEEPLKEEFEKYVGMVMTEYARQHPKKKTLVNLAPDEKEKPVVKSHSK